MKHKTFGKLAFLGVFAVAGCYSYASESINNGDYNTVQATPSFSRLTVGDSDQLLVRLVNNADNGAVTSYTVNNPNSGIQVHFQPNYRPHEDANADTLVADTGAKVQQEYYIVGVTPGTYTFTLTPTSVNTSVSATVTVVVTPKNLGAALSVHSILSGDTVTVTAPPGTVFSLDSSVVTVAGATVSVLSRSADSTTITFVVTGGTLNVAAPVTVSHVGLISSPATQTSTVATTDSLTIPALTISMNKSGSLSSGDTVIVTGGPRAVFSPTSAVSFTAGSTPIVVSRAADSSSIKFLVGPGDTGSVSVTLVGVRGDSALGTYTLKSTNTINVPAVNTATATVSNASPAFGAIDTVTLGGGLKFAPNDTITVAGTPAYQAGLSADSTMAYFVAAAPGGGAIAFRHVKSGPFDLTVSSNATVTVGAAMIDPNAGSPATASTVTLNGSKSVFFADAGAGVPCTSGLLSAFGAGTTCRYYNITVAAGTITAAIHWSDLGADNDMAVALATNNTAASCVAVLADNQGAVSGATGDASSQPINCAEAANTTLTAGTYTLVVVNFGYTGKPWPAWVLVQLSQP